MLQQLSRVALSLSSRYIKNCSRLTPRISKRYQSSIQTSEKSAKVEERVNKLKVRRAYALGGCLMFIWISTHGILLYRRRSEHRTLNEKLPPISWDDFVERFLSNGEVKTIVFQPHFEVANVYLHSAREQQMKKTVVDMIHTTPDKFSRPPDVRFHIEASSDELKLLVTEACQKYKQNIAFEIDQFPSYRELSFIIGSSLFVLAAISMAK